MDPTAAKYIGAGIACIGMGGAGAGVGIIFRKLSRGCFAKSFGCTGPVRQFDLRICRNRSAWHLLATGCSPAAVCVVESHVRSLAAGISETGHGKRTQQPY